MANINKIKLSGQTYNIQDQNAQPLLTAGQGITIDANNVISATGGGGGGITSGEVQTMIDESISGKTNQNDNLFTIRTNVIETVVIAGGAKLKIIFAFDIIQNNQIVLSTDTVNDKSSLLSALATLGFDNKIYDIRGINYSESTLKTSYFGECLGHKCYAVLLGYVPDFGSITIGLKRNNVYYTLDSVSSGKYDYNYLSNKPSITTSITSASTDSEIPSAKAVYDAIPQGGGGKAIVGGRGITVTSGETADTVSFNLPISAGTLNYSIQEGKETSAMSYYDHAEGYYTYANGSGYAAHAEGYQTSAMTSSCHAEGRMTKANGNNAHAEGFSTVANGGSSHAEGNGTKASSSYSHAEGYDTSASSVSNVSGIDTYMGHQARHAEGCNTLANNSSTHTEGYYTVANNFGEHASGVYNNSTSASTTWGNSGNTLFSVGNGTANNARHNAFEIRQNGDIYCSDGTNDVKLQDTITATSANTTALGGLKLVKLSQSEYDSLATKDNSTLYVIVN